MTPLVSPLVTAGELAALLDRGDATAADVRWYLDGRSGHAAFEAGHVPGAVFVDLDTVLAAPRSCGPGRHPLPSPEDFAAGMSALGIGDEDHVVAYDDAGGSIAARLWWMLAVTGRRASVLDGGIACWPGPIETGRPQPRPRRHFEARPWPSDAVVDAATVDVARQSSDAVVLDARAPERYRGDVEPIDPRPGHVPGAKSAPWAANLAADGRFLPADVLRTRYESLGVGADVDTIAYCGSGVTACHDLLALRVAGFDRARLYEGSWSDWSADAHRPAEVG